MRKVANRIVPLAAIMLLPSCVPYRVGSTARTIEPGETETTGAISFIPAGGGYSADDDFGDGPFVPHSDVEARYGLDEHSDVGVRLVNASGLVINYKRRFLGTNEGPAMAYMAGAGLINLANHAHFEFTLIASGSERSGLVPYGGMRAMQVLPLQDDAVSDEPSIGVFAGARVGQVDLYIIPELGFFYDPSALGRRESDYTFVPSITIHGDLIEALF